MRKTISYCWFVVFATALSLGQATTADSRTPPADANPPVYRVGGEVKPPRPVYTPDPEYTLAARRARLQGIVVVNIVLMPDGRARDLRVVRPLGLGLDEEAIEAVKKWKFEPARMNGKPVTVNVTVEVAFRLRD